MLRAIPRLKQKILTLLVASVAVISTSFAQASTVKSMRFWQSPESTRVVIDLSTASEHKLEVLKNPDRIVIDIPGSKLNVDLSELEIGSDLVKKVRISKPPAKDVLRLVLDLKKAATPKSFSLKPYQNYGDRLVIDLFTQKRAEEKTVQVPEISNNRDIVIAIDAGHGGDDPGSIGKTGVREKNITLSISKKLAALINKEKGLKAVLTRKSDYYLKHRKRTAIARQHRADLFVSVHADSFTSPKARGASVWVLSTRGVKSEIAHWLRKLESDSELLGGVDTNLDLSNYEKPIAKVILDLQMEHSIEASFSVANEVHAKMSKTAPKMHKNHVEQNNFLVLKNPDIPSILVESGFISNPKEEALLKNKSYQQKLAKSVLEGIKGYFKKNSPDGSLYASLYKRNFYQVQRGDSLSRVAQRFNVSVGDLKKVNKLKSSMVRIGQKLIIPSPQ